MLLFINSLFQIITIQQKFGLSLASSILPNWIRGNDPLEHLFRTKRIEAFQNEFDKNPGMIDKYFTKPPTSSFNHGDW